MHDLVVVIGDHRELVAHACLLIRFRDGRHRYSSSCIVRLSKISLAHARPGGRHGLTVWRYRWVSSVLSHVLALLGDNGRKYYGSCIVRSSRFSLALEASRAMPFFLFWWHLLWTGFWRDPWDSTWRLKLPSWLSLARLGRLWMWMFWPMIRWTLGT